MSLWGNLDAQNNAPKQTDTTGYGGDTPQVTGNGQVYYANTAVGDYIDFRNWYFWCNTNEQPRRKWPWWQENQTRCSA